MRTQTIEVMMNAVISRNKGKWVDEMIHDLLHTFGLKADHITEVAGLVLYKGTGIAGVSFYDNGRIKDVLYKVEHLEQFVDLTALDMECPLCGDGTLEYRPAPNPLSTPHRLTHIHVCDTCPAVLLEWYNPTDTEALGKELN